MPGIWFFTSQSTVRSYEKNFKVLLDKARQICRMPTNRSLSIKLKVTVANSLITSVFQYPCSHIYTPPEVFNEFWTIISSFIWDNKKAKIAYNTLTLPIAEWGAYPHWSGDQNVSRPHSSHTKNPSPAKFWGCSLSPVHLGNLSRNCRTTCWYSNSGFDSTTSSQRTRLLFGRKLLL